MNVLIEKQMQYPHFMIGEFVATDRLVKCWTSGARPFMCTLDSTRLTGIPGRPLQNMALEGHDTFMQTFAPGT